MVKLVLILYEERVENYDTDKWQFYGINIQNNHIDDYTSNGLLGIHCNGIEIVTKMDFWLSFSNFKRITKYTRRIAEK